jgi:CYTH domain-containing protein
VSRARSDGVEIERKFLLNRMPSIPPGAEVLRIEQGYLPAGEPARATTAITHGRLRRTTMPNGSTHCTHTIKSGEGMVRRENEREISLQQFEQAWPDTAGRRLSKMRHRIADGNLVWEIDEFGGIDLILAEVELPAADAEIQIPAWLAPHIVREVTDEPQFTNVNIALQRFKHLER